MSRYTKVIENKVQILQITPIPLDYNDTFSVSWDCFKNFPNYQKTNYEEVGIVAQWETHDYCVNRSTRLWRTYTKMIVTSMMNCHVRTTLCTEAERWLRYSVNHTNIGSDIGLSPVWRHAIIWTQAIIWTNRHILNYTLRNIFKWILI